METRDEPLAYFITWTVYGTFLHGDLRWWRQQGKQNPPRPQLERWQRERLKHDVILLNEDHRQIVDSQIVRHCEIRNWKLWAANTRSNHVHVVVTSPGYQGTTVRDQLKANGTGGLRRHDKAFLDRPVWTTKGDVAVIWTEDEMERVIAYTGDVQDRMNRPKD